MELQQAWQTVNFYLEHIAMHTKELRQKASVLNAVSETVQDLPSVIEGIDLAEKELAEALRLSRSAEERLRNLHSSRRKNATHEQTLRPQPT